MNTQEDFYKAIDEWYNIFLTWWPWTGKSYISKLWRQNNPSNHITLAPTWMVAIDSWWVTIHSAFKIYGNNFNLIKSPVIDWSKVDKLFIEEISMVSCDMFDYIDKCLRVYRKSSKPFWWLQVIVIWDLEQIEPIFNLSIEQDKKRYEELKWNVLFTNSKVYSKWKFTKIDLQKPYRSDDPLLNSLLNRLRNKDLTAIDEFKRWDNDDYIHLFPYNSQVDSYNQKHLDKIKKKEHIYIWKVSWEFNHSITTTPKELILKVWAKIMFTCNYWWLYNWDLGTVKKINKDSIVIFSTRLQQDIEVEKYKFKEIWFINWKEFTKWTFTQYPLRLAYAISIHKCQWLTLQNLVFKYHKWINIKLAYVALSRWVSYDTILIN